MEFQLINGSFTSKVAEKLISDLIHVKIKFHENEIKGDTDEETIKMRENRIIKLQNELVEVRKFISFEQGPLIVKSSISISY
jgi:hypothetical protein